MPLPQYRYVELVKTDSIFEPHESFFTLFSDPRSTRLARIHLREQIVQDQDLEAIRKQVVLPRQPPAATSHSSTAGWVPLESQAPTESQDSILPWPNFLWENFSFSLLSSQSHCRKWDGDTGQDQQYVASGSPSGMCCSNWEDTPPVNSFLTLISRLPGSG